MRAIIFLTSFQALYNIVESNIVLKAILYKSVLCTILLKAILYNIVKELCAKSVSILSAASWLMRPIFCLLMVFFSDTLDFMYSRTKHSGVEVRTLGRPWHFASQADAAFIKLFTTEACDLITVTESYDIQRVLVTESYDIHRVSTLYNSFICVLSLTINLRSNFQQMVGLNYSDFDQKIIDEAHVFLCENCCFST